MATVCGGSLALKAAGFLFLNLVAGVAMGMVVEGDKYSVLTDIMGLEDHDGDMDFKVAGTKMGLLLYKWILKLVELNYQYSKEALLPSKRGKRTYLTLMEKNAATDIVPSDALPLVEQFAMIHLK